MSASSIGGAASLQIPQATHSSAQHRSRTHAPSISDVDAQGASATAKSKGSGAGSRIDVKV
jgi:hypothetical protein